MAAAVGHDWCYQAEWTPLGGTKADGRRLADEAYRLLYARAGGEWRKVWTEYTILRAFGWAAYRNHTPESVICARVMGSVTPIYAVADVSGK